MRAVQSDVIVPCPRSPQADLAWCEAAAPSPSVPASSGPRQGLVLLVVLGMLGLFSLLAVTYVTISAQSRTASQALVRAKLQKPPGVDNLSEKVIEKIIRGDTAVNSAFHGHSLLEDIYGRDPIEGSFRTGAGTTELNTPGRPDLLKLQLNPEVTLNPDTYRLTPAENTSRGALSVENDTYTGRILTFLEGPLANQSFRILSYLGDPVFDNSNNPLPTFSYSIAIDLSESKQRSSASAVTRGSAVANKTELSRTPAEWLAISGGDPRIFTEDAGVGYRYLINDTPFSGLGYGLENDPNQNNFGNLDQSRLVPGAQPTGGGYQAGGESLPIALLPNYDYLKADSRTGSLGRSYVNNTWVDVNGGTNEGFDVPDYRDYWLAHLPEAVNNQPLRQGDMIPSFHRPELVNYIAQYFSEISGGDITSLTANQVARLVTLIDYASARPLSYILRQGPNVLVQRNVDFSGRLDAKAIPSLDLDLSNWGSGSSVSDLRRWVKALIGGGNAAPQDEFAWDIDNDGDGIAESIWVDPNLPLITGANGQVLKVLAAPFIIDLDGRVNINASGDLYQRGFIDGTNSYRTTLEAGTDPNFLRSGLNNRFLPQGLGYGPGEIVLAGLISNYGANPPELINFLTARAGRDPDNSSNIFHVPGRYGQETIGRFFNQRGFRFDGGGNTYGLKQSRRGRLSYGLDRMGNPRMSDSSTGLSDEESDDAYETSLIQDWAGDALVTLEELETVLRRYDVDVAQLPDRLRRLFANRSVNDVLFSSITARSMELRHPNMAAIARHNRTYAKPNYPNVPFPRQNHAGGVFSEVPPVPTRLIANNRNEGSMLRWIQMLYDERFPGEPPLNIADIRDLFPLEFRQALRLDINRPLANGLDDDNDGLIDEPQELIAQVQQEPFPPTGSTPGTYYTTGVAAGPNDPLRGNIPPAVWNQYMGPLNSRKMLARQLYVLAQLLIAPNYSFAGVAATDPNYLKLRARCLAQWAVNVVDFRDVDSAMTRFEYDETPFRQDAGDPGVWYPKEDAVVWGMEFPDLLMTETLAFHDKRVKDTEAAGAMDELTTAFMNPDDDFDQYRIPEGSAYIELYCPRSPNSPTTAASLGTADRNLGAVPSNLYNAAGELLLSRVAPSSSGIPSGLPSNPDYGPQPVFRIGIARLPPGQDPGSLLATKNFPQLNQATNQTSALAVQNSAYGSSGLVSQVATPASNNFPGQGTPLRFDRIVWFTNNAVGGSQSIPDLVDGEDPAVSYFNEREHRVFRNAAGGNLTLGGGQYLVVGPRLATNIGMLQTPANPPDYDPNPHRIELDPAANNVNVFDSDNNSMRPSWPVRPAKAMIATANPPPNWPLTGGIGFNISEPTPSAARYYQAPTDFVNSTAAKPFPLQDAYADLGASETSLPDEPFDNESTLNLERLAAENKQKPGTYPLHRTAYLQRLADPDLPYHPIYNPYLTIDWMSMDLTVYNGEDREPVDDPGRTDPNGAPAPYTAPADEVAINTGFGFQSRYKDGARITDAPNDPNVVSQGTATGTPRYAYTDPTLNDVQTGISIFSSSTAYLIKSDPRSSYTSDPPYFKMVLGHVTPDAITGPSSLTLGYINAGRQDTSNRYDGFGDPSTTATGGYVGTAQLPQGGLFWLDRPLASPYEIMMVPFTGPGQYGQLFVTPKNLANPGRPEDGFVTGQYDISARPGNAPPVPWTTPFGNLPAFLSSPISKVENTGPTTPFWQQFGPNSNGAGWNLLLELIETQPPYDDSHRWINPANMNNSTPIETWMLGTRVPPFNYFTTYRTPGKVNLNTAAQLEVWKALELNYDQSLRNSNPSPGTLNRWTEFKDVRRGYSVPATRTGSFFSANPNDGNANLDAYVPSQFRGAFRSSFSANIDVPDPPGFTPSPPLTVMPTEETMRMKHSSYAHLLRPNSRQPNDSSLFGQHWEAHRGLTPNAAEDAFLAAEFSRSPFSYYQRLMRLPNLTTNQSNVLAVWVTIGLFEYDEVSGIGAEYLSPAGVPERTHTFYLIDRSIPVGFAPGRTLNSDKTILLRRKIPR